MPVTIDQAREAKPGVIDDLLKDERLAHLKGGVGVAKQGEDYCVRVNLTAEPPRDAFLPDNYHGVPIVYRVIGQVNAQEK